MINKISKPSINKKLLISSGLLLFIYLSAGKIINSNSLYYILFLSITILSYLNFKKPLTLFLKISHDLLPIYFYFFYFLISSIWSLYPSHSVYFVINDSIYLIASILFALIYHQSTIKGIILFFQFVAYLAMILTVGMFIFIPDLMTIGGSSASILFVILPYLFISDQTNVVYKYIPIFFSVIIILMSVSRTPLVAASVSTIITLVIIHKSFFDFVRTILKYLILVIMIIYFLSFIPFVKQILILFVFKFSGVDFGYTSRVLVYHEDDLRTSIFNEAFNLYNNYWVQGIGYMNFMKWYGQKFGVSEITANGNEIVGMNLHNSFQTWALEGGFFLLLIIVYILYVYFKRSIYKIKCSQNQFEKNFHIIGLINIVSFAIFASYHQLHQNIIFFILLGIVLKRKNVENSFVSSV